MRKLIKILMALTVLVAVAPVGIKVADKVVAGKLSSITINKAYKEQVIPKAEDNLESGDVKQTEVKKIINLEDTNTVVLRGPVTDSSVAKAMKQLQTASRRVSKDATIYLVLDTPGGSVDAGLDLIDFAKALPQKVDTITLFAASMGFQIVQNLNTRYITTNGTLMSHRARVEGMGGQIKGEFESRYKMLRRSIDYLDFQAANRMGMDPKAYDQLIFNEYWVYGFDAISAKAADQQVLVKCGDSLDGSDKVVFNTLFGTITVTFSKCPLIKAPESVELSGSNAAQDAQMRDLITMAIEDKPRFVKEYISTDRFYEVFK